MKITFECGSVAEIEELRAWLNARTERDDLTPSVKALAGDAAEGKDKPITLERLIDEFVNFPDERQDAAIRQEEGDEA